MRVVTHRSVTVPVREALHGWLPHAELAVALLDTASGTVELADDEGRIVAVAVFVEGQPSLSGAPGLVACAGAGAGGGVAAAVADLARSVAARAVLLGRVEVVGPAALAEPIVREAARRIGGEVSSVMAQRLMAATTARSPGGVPGSGRRAAVGELELVARWLDDFGAEALGAAPRGTEHWVQRLEGAGWHPWVWEVQGTPVSLVNARTTTPCSSRIGPVYTPPEHRRNGYAAALTAHVSAALLAGGDERVTLFTDATNPASNALYARVGFADVGAHGSWLLSLPGEVPGSSA